jgi:hypothetical protein
MGFFLVKTIEFWKEIDYVKNVLKLMVLKRLSFRRRPESSLFKTIWMPDQVWHDGQSVFINRL